MEKDRLSSLLQQHLDGHLPPQDADELVLLLERDADKDLFNTVLAGMMMQQSPAMPANELLWQKMVQDIVNIDKPRVKRITRRTWMAAAAVLFLIGMAVFFVIQKQQPASIVRVTDPKPPLALTPVDKNVLVLADGKTIYLDEIPNGEVAHGIVKNDHVLTYSSRSSSAVHVLSVAKGSMYQLLLSDGSHVWLNAASSIRFPAAFNNNERIVELSGEAFFDVQHAAQHPFIVKTDTVSTTVMGTAFDVKAYPAQPAIEVAVQRGKVKVLNTLLQKGEQVRVVTKTSLSKRTIDTTSIAAWRQGDLIYKDEYLQEVVADLQRVFNVNIVVARTDLSREIVRVSFNKNIGIRKALEIICGFTDTHLIEQDGIYTIK